MIPQANKRPHLATIDLLRLIAALAVVFFHVFFRGATGDVPAGQAYPEVAGVALYGYLGVNLFFLVSGYVIAWSAEGRSVERFALAKIVRLYPAFLVCMTATFLVLLAAGGAAYPVSFNQYLANLVMFAPALGQPFMDGVYWSIVIEIVFYGWVTVALATGTFGRCKLELIAAWLAIAAVNEIVIGSGVLRLLFITEFGPFFAAGILTHHLQTRGRSPDALLLLAAAFALSCVTLTVTQRWMLDRYGVAVPLPGLIAANVVMHAALFCAVAGHALLAPARWTLAAGGLTYPLYLLHQNIGYLAIDALTPIAGRWAAAGLVIAALAAASWAVWRYIEPPAQGLLRKWLTPVTEFLGTAMRKAKPWNIRKGAAASAR